MELGDYIGIFVGLFFVVINLVLTIIAFRTRMSWIMFPVIAIWVVIALSLNPFVAAEWDIYYILRILAIAMAVASAIMLWGIIAMGRKSKYEPSEFDDYVSEIDAHNAELDKLRSVTGGRRRRVNAQKREVSNGVASVEDFYKSRKA